MVVFDKSVAKFNNSELRTGMWTRPRIARRSPANFPGQRRPGRHRDDRRSQSSLLTMVICESDVSAVDAGLQVEDEVAVIGFRK
jgi:hypothetical protein